MRDGIILEMGVILYSSRPASQMVLFVQDIVKMLGEVKQLSPPGQLLRALSVVHLADLNSAVPMSAEDQEKSIKSSFQSYCSAQNILLQQVPSVFFPSIKLAALALSESGKPICT